MTKRLLLLLTLLVARPAHADDFVRARLVQDGEHLEGCPTTATLASAANEMLGRGAVTSGTADVSVHYRLQRSVNGVSADLTLRRSDGSIVGTRRVETPELDCSGLDERLALVLALMVDLPRQSAELALPPKPTPWLRSYRGSAGLAVDVGWLTSTRLGARIEQLVELGPLPRLGFALDWWPKHELVAEGEHFELEAWEVGVLACPRLLTDPIVVLELCGSLSAGRLLASSTTLPFPQAARGTTVELALGPSLGVRLVGPLLLMAEAAPVWSVIRDRGVFIDENGEELEAFVTPVLHGTASAALALEFSR